MMPRGPAVRMPPRKALPYVGASRNMPYYWNVSKKKQAALDGRVARDKRDRRGTACMRDAQAGGGRIREDQNTSQPQAGAADMSKDEGGRQIAHTPGSVRGRSPAGRPVPDF